MKQEPAELQQQQQSQGVPRQPSETASAADEAAEQHAGHSSTTTPAEPAPLQQPTSGAAQPQLRHARPSRPARTAGRPDASSSTAQRSHGARVAGAVGTKQHVSPSTAAQPAEPHSLQPSSAPAAHFQLRGQSQPHTPAQTAGRPDPISSAAQRSHGARVADAVATHISSLRSLPSSSPSCSTSRPRPAQLQPASGGSKPESVGQSRLASPMLSNCRSSDPQPRPESEQRQRAVQHRSRRGMLLRWRLAQSCSSCKPRLPVQTRRCQQPAASMQVSHLQQQLAKTQREAHTACEEVCKQNIRCQLLKQDRSAACSEAESLRAQLAAASTQAQAAMQDLQTRCSTAEHAASTAANGLHSQLVAVHQQLAAAEMSAQSSSAEVQRLTAWYASSEQAKQHLQGRILLLEAQNAQLLLLQPAPARPPSAGACPCCMRLRMALLSRFICSACVVCGQLVELRLGPAQAATRCSMQPICTSI